MTEQECKDLVDSYLGKMQKDMNELYGSIVDSILNSEMIKDYLTITGTIVFPKNVSKMQDSGLRDIAKEQVDEAKEKLSLALNDLIPIIQKSKLLQHFTETIGVLIAKHSENELLKANQRHDNCGE